MGMIYTDYVQMCAMHFTSDATTETYKLITDEASAAIISRMRSTICHIATSSSLALC